MIRDGDFIILKRENTMRVVQARKNGRPIIHDRQKFYLDNIFGHPYGSRFDVDKNSCQLILRSEDFVINDADLSSGTDNRNLVSSNEENQTLDKDDILSLKRVGLTGEELVSELIKNSATFNQKTKFSQEKWIKKKKKKHLYMFTIQRPCTRLITEMYYLRDPSKICYLRMDTLAQILTLGNIHASSKVLLVENCQGLLAGSILDRIGVDGKLVQLFANANPMKGRSAFDDFGYTKELQRSRMRLYPLSLLCELSMFQSANISISPPPSKKPRFDEASSPLCNEVNRNMLPEQNNEDNNEDELGSPLNAADLCHDLNQKHEDDNNKTDGPNNTEDLLTRTHERTLSKEYLESNKFDVLVVAVKYNPSQLVLRLLELMKLSSTICVYHQYKEPLMEVFVQLKERGGSVNLRLSETWLRDIQVLPDRTHPAVLMSGTSGYLLTGTVVERSKQT